MGSPRTRFKGADCAPGCSAAILCASTRGSGRERGGPGSRGGGATPPTPTVPAPCPVPEVRAHCERADEEHGRPGASLAGRGGRAMSSATGGRSRRRPPRSPRIFAPSAFSIRSSNSLWSKRPSAKRCESASAIIGRSASKTRISDAGMPSSRPALPGGGGVCCSRACLCCPRGRGRRSQALVPGEQIGGERRIALLAGDKEPGCCIQR